VIKQTRLLASLLAVGMACTSPMALADDPIKDIIDHEVPALKDGTRIAVPDVERAILDACARRKFAASVVSPGQITARWENRGHWFDVAITYTDAAYSIRYQDSQRMDYNAAKRRIDDAYNEYVAALTEHIEADFERALKRLKQSQKLARK
jgi:hypothetical protein